MWTPPNPECPTHPPTPVPSRRPHSKHTPGPDLPLPARPCGAPAQASSTAAVCQCAPESAQTAWPFPGVGTVAAVLQGAVVDGTSSSSPPAPWGEGVCHTVSANPTSLVSRQTTVPLSSATILPLSGLGRVTYTSLLNAQTRAYTRQYQPAHLLRLGGTGHGPRTQNSGPHAHTNEAAGCGDRQAVPVGRAGRCREGSVRAAGRLVHSPYTRRRPGAQWDALSGPPAHSRPASRMYLTEFSRICRIKPAHKTRPVRKEVGHHQNIPPNHKCMSEAPLYLTDFSPENSVVGCTAQKSFLHHTTIVVVPQHLLFFPPSLRPATVSLTPSASFNGICN